MPRLVVETYYNNNPVTVKVLYKKMDTLFDDPEPDIEIVAAYLKNKKALDIEELSEDEEFMFQLREDVQILLEQEEPEEEEDDSED